MTAVKNLEKLNKIEEREFGAISKLVFESINTMDYNTNVIIAKEELIAFFSEFLVKHVPPNDLRFRQLKLLIFNFIDNLNMEKELLALKNGEINISDIKLAAKRLGQKSQSAFEAKNK